MGSRYSVQIHQEEPSTPFPGPTGHSRVLGRCLGNAEGKREVVVSSSWKSAPDPSSDWTTRKLGLRGWLWSPMSRRDARPTFQPRCRRPDPLAQPHCVLCCLSSTGLEVYPMPLSVEIHRPGLQVELLCCSLFKDASLQTIEELAACFSILKDP